MTTKLKLSGRMKDTSVFIEPVDMASSGYYTFGIYEYSTYPDTTVVAGRECRTFVDAFDTLAEAESAYPEAIVTDSARWLAESPIPGQWSQS